MTQRFQAWGTGRIGMPIITSEETEVGAPLEQWQDHLLIFEVWNSKS